MLLNNFELQADPEELEKRAAFLRGQRDKLLQLKRAEREKQLEAAAPTARPKSAKAARSALGRGAGRQDIDPRFVEKYLSFESHRPYCTKRYVT